MATVCIVRSGVHENESYRCALSDLEMLLFAVRTKRVVVCALAVVLVGLSVVEAAWRALSSQWEHLWRRIKMIVSRCLTIGMRRCCAGNP